MRILLVEDARNLAASIKKGLVEQGFAVDQAFDGEEGLYLAENESYDLVILDVMLPKVDGITICKTLREKGKAVPVLMLTAKSQLEDKVSGLDAGADDYLTKPFAFVELRSRINALLRRSHRQTENKIVIADLEIDTLKHDVKRESKKIELTPKEFSLLEYLARHKDEAVTRIQLQEHTWDYNFESLSNVVDVFVAMLRKKIDGNRGKKLIKTIRGIGYKLSAD